VLIEECGTRAPSGRPGAAALCKDAEPVLLVAREKRRSKLAGTDKSRVWGAERARGDHAHTILTDPRKRGRVQRHAAALATTRAAQFECETRIKRGPNRIGAWQRHALLGATARAANTRFGGVCRDTQAALATTGAAQFECRGGPLRETRKNPMRALGNPREEKLGRR
jgi:hypothetical protein